MPTAPAEPVIERLDPARLDELEPLWGALLARHTEVWDRLPIRSPDESWQRRRHQYEGWLADEASFVLVARLGGAPVGYILVNVADGDETYLTGERMAQIETLVVADGERDAGLGSRLFDAAMLELQGLQVDDVLVGYMHGNEAARRFYERRGFSPFVHLLYAKRPAPGQTAEEDT